VACVTSLTVLGAIVKVQVHNTPTSSYSDIHEIAFTVNGNLKFKFGGKFPYLW